MAVSFRISGAVASGTASISIPYPAGIVAGDLLVIFVNLKLAGDFSTAFLELAAAAGFTPVVGSSGGVGTGGGIDTGSVLNRLFIKIAVGNETGSVAGTSQGGQNINSMIGRMFCYNYDKTKSLDLFYKTFSHSPATATAAISIIPGTGFSTPTNSTPTPLIIGGAGEVSLVAFGINADTYTYSAQTLAVTGVTYSAVVERQDSGTNSGADTGLLVTEHSVTAGTNSDASMTYNVTSSGSTATAPTGAFIFVHLKEGAAAAATSFDPMGMMGIFGL